MNFDPSNTVQRIWHATLCINTPLINCWLINVRLLHQCLIENKLTKSLQLYQVYHFYHSLVNVT